MINKNIIKNDGTENKASNQANIYKSIKAVHYIN